MSDRARLTDITSGVPALELGRELLAARAEIERLEAVGRNAADLLEQKGYDETAAAVRAAIDNIVATRPASR